MSFRERSEQAKCVIAHSGESKAPICLSLLKFTRGSHCVSPFVQMLGDKPGVKDGTSPLYVCLVRGVNYRLPDSARLKQLCGNLPEGCKYVSVFRMYVMLMFAAMYALRLKHCISKARFSHKW